MVNKSELRKNMGVDIGGTKIHSAVVDENGKILKSQIDPTPKTQDGISELIAKHFKLLAKNYEIASIGIGAAGMVYSDQRTVKDAPNVGFFEYALADNVEKRIANKANVIVENDANVAGWAEYKKGVAAGCDPVITFTIGTGLGGAVIANGQLLRGHNGMAAEFGHFIMVPDGEYCGCGLRGCFEQYCSGTALTNMTRQLAKRSPKQAAKLIKLASSIDQIQGPMITELALKNDAFSISCLQRLGKYLGRGIGAMCAVFDPQMVVIGGGLVKAESIITDPMLSEFLNNLVSLGHREEPEIRFAKYGNEAGVIGAALLADSQLN